MSKFSNEYYDPNHPGFKRLAATERLGAIVKMKPGQKPPREYVRMHIAADIWTIEASEEELREFSKAPNIISLKYARPMQQLTKIVNNMPKGEDGDCTTGPRPPQATVQPEGES